MKPNIYILSKAIKTGKTTELISWCNFQKNVGGILTPDVDGYRKLFDIDTKEYFDFEVNTASTDSEVTIVGRFRFYNSAFTLAQQILLENTNKKYLIIDEIGRLEINQNIGLEFVLKEIINQYVNNSIEGNLILVVRDYLLLECIEKYKLFNAKIIQSVSEITDENKLFGLILGGGKSSRMNTDKAFIIYRNKEQVYYLSDQLKHVCKDVLISLNRTQNNNLNQQYQYIYDNAIFENSGPIGALLTALESNKNDSFFVLGCDYPLLDLNDILNLKNHFIIHNKTVSYFNNNSNYREPLLAIYHKNDLEKLLQFYKNGNTSLQQFLDEIEAIKIIPSNLNNITSIDTLIDFEKIKTNNFQSS